MPLERLFTAGSVLPQEMIRFADRGGLLAPEDWRLEAAASFREALLPVVPAQRQSVEENTMPSWLWRRRAQGAATASETHVLDVIDRIAGAATYKGWKCDLWEDEVEASTFYDEARALLLTRRLVFAPKDMARLGLDWAYGLAPSAAEALPSPTDEPATLILQNDSIDAILAGGVPAALNKWHRFLESSQSQASVRVAFADTMAEWSAGPAPLGEAPRAMLNLMAFRHDDGSLDLTGLQQATLLAVMLLDLHADSLVARINEGRDLALGFGNLAPLLMSLALPYDSEAGRATAAALTALITGAAVKVSALGAARLGPCPAFAARREGVLRGLENQLRAAFDEKNDYDRLSIRPQTLRLDSGVDLVLLSTARHAFEEAVDLVKQHGLRNLRLTALNQDAALAPLMDSYAQGIAAMPALFCDYERAADVFERRVCLSVDFALEKLGCDCADKRAVADHVAGYRTLIAAPGVSHTLLREKGFDEAALARLEAALAQAGHIRQAFTPWILGVDFCRDRLGVPAKSFKNPAFDLLRFLGFSSQEIALANAFCCGHGHVRGVLEVAEKDWPIFAVRDDLAPEAQIKMAAAAQSFVMGDVGLRLAVPASVSPQARGQLLLMAWSEGLRSVTLDLDGPPLAPRDVVTNRILKRKTTGTAAHHIVPLAPARTGRAKATTRTLALGGRAGRARSTKEKRG